MAIKTIVDVFAASFALILFFGALLIWAAGLGALCSYYQRSQSARLFEGEE